MPPYRFTEPPDAPPRPRPASSDGTPPEGGDSFQRWLAAAVLVAVALGELARRAAREGRDRVGAFARTARARSVVWWARARPRLARGVRTAGCWLAAALVASIEAVERGARTTRRAARTSARTWQEQTWPRLRATGQTSARRLHAAASASARHARTAGRATARHARTAGHHARTAGRAAAQHLRTAEAVCDRWVTRATILAQPWWLRAADGVAITLEVRLPVAWARGRAAAPGVARAAAVQGRRAGAALARASHPLRLLRQAALASAMLLAAGTAVVAFGIPAVHVASQAVGVHVGQPGPLPGLAQRSVIVDADGTRLAFLHDAENRRIVAPDDIPQHVREAVIAAEDRRFYDHSGYDVGAIGRALRENIEATAVVQGGSTITQQLAKQNYVGDDQTLDRKVEELFHAIGLEERYSKDQLLERYLHQVYFGAGAYGIAAAAEEFFRVEPADLTVGEAALLASQIRAPGVTDPRANPETAAARRDLVLERMVAEGFLDRSAADEVMAEPVEVQPPLDQTPTEPYVVEAVKREFLANPAFGDTRAERLEALFTGGLRIETTLDQPLQTLARDVVEAHVTALDGPTAALAAVEPGTGRVLAIAAGGTFDETQFDLATQSRRQAGSAFKTFAVVAALESGMTPETGLEGDSPQEHPLPDDKEWVVHNFAGRSHGEVDLRESVVRSVNTAFAEVALEVGHERIIEVAQRLGVSPAAFGDPSSHGPAVVLGGLTHGVSPLEMAAAYATLAGGGAYAEPYLVERVVDRDGEVVFEREPQAEQVLDPEVAATTRALLQEAVQHGTGQAAQLDGWPVAGKTGTTQDSADAWFVGTVPPLSVAVWIGHPEARIPIPGLTGGSASAPIWADFVGAALEGTEPVGYGD